MNFYKETTEDRIRNKNDIDKKIQSAIHKNQSSFKEWWLKPITLEVSKWVVIGIFAFIAAAFLPYIKELISAFK